MFDAIMFTHPRGGPMPKKRSPHQRYVFLTYEPPAYWPVRTSQNGFFNWTATYKGTSDFQVTYGRVKRKRDHPEGDALQSYIRDFGRRNRHLAGNRTEFKAAWFVSNCNSKSGRNEIVSALTRHMQVDVYGACGPFRCDKDSVGGPPRCLEAVAKKYRFYLSFENSVCDDYVTEKFFKILFHDVIPLTFGGGPYHEIAPPQSYINVLDFDSVRELAAHLRELQEDDAKYAEYFWWKNFYTVEFENHTSSKSYCELCRRLNDPQEPVKVYRNLKRWWEADSHCRRVVTKEGEEHLEFFP